MNTPAQCGAIKPPKTDIYSEACWVSSGRGRCGVGFGVRSVFCWLAVSGRLVVAVLVLSVSVVVPVGAVEGVLTPTGLTASSTVGGVLLEWDGPVGDSGSVTGYRILRRRVDVGERRLSQLVRDTGTALTSYLDESAVDGGVYIYRVRAMRGGVRSAKSDKATVVYEAPPVLERAASGEPEFEVVWSSVLSVGALLGDVPGFQNYQGPSFAQGSLLEDRFVVDGESVWVIAVFNHAGLVLGLSDELPRDFVFRAGSQEFVASDSSVQSMGIAEGRYWWPTAPMGWSEGDEVELSIAISVSGSMPQRPPAPPSGVFDDKPTFHDGVSQFEVRLGFDHANLAINAQTLKDHGLAAAGAEIAEVRRYSRSSKQSWIVALQPTGPGAITVMLPATVDCAHPGAVCTNDGRGLRHRIETTIPGSADASLAALDVVGADLAPMFDPGETLYSAAAAPGVSQLTVAAAAAAAAQGATVSITPADADVSAAGHQVLLATGADTAIHITVTAPDAATTQRYWLVVSESSAPTDATSALNSMQFTGLGSLTFDDHQNRYQLTAPPNMSHTTVVASRADSGATVETITVRVGPDGLHADHDDADTNQPGHQVPLAETGDTLVIVRVTSHDGLNQSVYLTLITQTTDTGATPKAVTPPPSTSTTALKSAPSPKDTTDNAAPVLSSLTLTDADLSPVFASDTFQYRATAASDVEEITIDAATDDTDASLLIVPADTDPNTDGWQITLGAPGSETTIVVIVNSNGKLNSYITTVSRELSSLQQDSMPAFEHNPARDIDTMWTWYPRLWSDGEIMWATNNYDQRIYAYDLETGAPRPGRDITYRGGATRGLWSDGETLWVAIAGQQRVTAYNLATGARLKDRDFFLAADNSVPVGLWSDGVILWVSNANENDKVFAYDFETGDRLPDYDFDTLVAAGNTAPMGLWSDGATMWIADQDDGKLYAYELYTGVRVPSLDFNNLIAAVGHGLWSDGETMWVIANRTIRALNMPPMATTSRPAYALLQSLELTGIDIGFSPVWHGRTGFEVRVPQTTTSTTAVAVAVVADATVAITPADADSQTAGHQINLDTGDNTISVTVTNGTTTKTYSGVVTRTTFASLSDNADLLALDISGSDIGTISSATKYTASVAAPTTAPTVTATPADANAAVTITPADADSQTAGHQVSLNTGANTISIAVESSDGTKTKTYTITVNRASNAAFGWSILADFTELDGGNYTPRGIWSNGTTMWVANLFGRLFAYDLTTTERDLAKDIPTTQFGLGNLAPSGLWSDGTTIWVSDVSVGKIYAYDLATGAYQYNRDIGSLNSAANEHPVGLWSDGTTIWVSDNNTDKLYAYNRATRRRRAHLDINTLGVAGNNSPAGLWSDGTTMWVADDVDDKLYAYDLASGTRQADLDFNTLAAVGNNNPTGIWSRGATMWVADYIDNKIYSYNMPAYALLQSLELTGIDIGFSPGRLDYAIWEPATTASTTVAAAAVSAGATVAIHPSDADTQTAGHQIDLATGKNTIAVTVNDGTHTTSYTAVITRTTATTLSDNADLSALSIANSDLVVFNSAVTEYTANVANAVATTTVTAVSVDSHATVSFDPADADAGTEGHQVSLAEGANSVTIAVEATDGTTKTYTITINRASNADFGWSALSDFKELAADNGNPRGIWSDGTTMWVSDVSHRLVAYDLATGTRQANRDINTGNAGNNYPTGLWSDGTTIWVSDNGTDKIYAYDLATGAHRAHRDINTLVADHHAPLGIWSDGETMWVVNNYHPLKIYAYDLATGARRARRDIDTLGAAGNNSPVGLWSDGDTIWVADDARLYAYDLATGARQADLDFNTLAAAGNQASTGIWSNGTTMWVADRLDDKVYAYNMPANALLQSLELTGIDIGFSPGRLDYAVRVPNSTASTTVVPVAASAGTTVAIAPADADASTDGHQISLSTGDNTITVTVTNAADTKTYTATITRSTLATLSDNADLDTLAIAGSVIDVSNSARTEYTVNVAHSISSSIVTALPDDTNATVAINPADADNQTVGHQISLSTGMNTISIAVEATDGSSKTYKITVNRDSAADFGWNPTSDLTLWASAYPRHFPPAALWSNGTTIWVVLMQAARSKVYAYDLATGAPQPNRDLDTLENAGNHYPAGLWSDGTTIWVTDHIDKKVYAYDLATGARTAYREFNNYPYNDHLRGLWSDGTTMWVADDIDAMLYAYDLATGDHQPNRDINTGQTGNSRPTGLWSDGTTMWVADYADAMLYAYDLATGARQADLDFNTLAAAGNNYPLGIWSNGDTMWVADWNSRVFAYNMPTDE